ncbi:MAG: hypothetical protein BGO77_03955 [Caedibacter sp. 37-49]|nr:MAG: hypothetical protein BGO77_03955 [Caedibacter sp. 37-49]
MPNEIGSFSSASVSAESWAKGASQPDQMIPSEAYRNVTATPEFMIKIDGVDTKSTLENFKDHVQLFHFNYRLSRLTNPNAADQLYTSARVVIEDPVMVIPNGNFAPIIMNKLMKGDKIETIHIARLANIANINVIVQELTFTNSYFQTYEPKYDTVVVTFRPATIENKINSYDQAGTNTGSTSVKFDFTTGQLT